jgi:hypothetical protein
VCGSGTCPGCGQSCNSTLPNCNCSP